MSLCKNANKLTNYRMRTEALNLISICFKIRGIKSHKEK